LPILNYFEEIITRKKFYRYGNRMETQEMINSRREKQNQFSWINFQGDSSGEAQGQTPIIYFSPGGPYLSK